MCCGTYVHLENWIEGLKNTLKREVLKRTDFEDGTFTYYLVINIDGLLLFEGSPNSKVYLILVKVYLVKMSCLCAGIYCTNKSSNKELPSPDIYLQKFLIDIDALSSHPRKIANITCKLGNY